ncbi:uncharacterized protein LOC117334899, partial [Pecten maximus]|uniref:uncharacterized protein LOC117334899 n=1 Tax=Pecten maximus TaxID=6579 RepID=UPI001458805C
SGVSNPLLLFKSILLSVCVPVLFQYHRTLSSLHTHYICATVPCSTSICDRWESVPSPCEINLLDNMDVLFVLVLFSRFGKNLVDADRFGSSSSNPLKGVDSRVLTLIFDLENRVKNLEDTRAEDARRMSNMQQEIDEIKYENRRLQHLSSHRDVVTLKSETEKTPIGYRYDNHELDSGTTGMTNTVIAFHAILGSDVLAPAINHEMVFDRIITNRGNLYSEHTGTFTCQHPGTYVFSWSIRVQSGHFLDSHLVKNGSIMGSIISASGYHGNTNSGLVVIQIDSGDEVWVRVGNRDSGTNVYSYWSMFSGFKLI